MKIELIDRPYWIAKVKEIIDFIDEKQSEENKKMEDMWNSYKSKWWNRIFIGKDKDSELTGALAWRHFWQFYPSCMHGRQKERCQRLLKALQSNKTGIIYAEDKDVGLFE